MAMSKGSVDGKLSTGGMMTFTMDARLIPESVRSAKPFPVWRNGSRDAESAVCWPKRRHTPEPVFAREGSSGGPELPEASGVRHIAMAVY